jgi:hypothetical protein
MVNLKLLGLPFLNHPLKELNLLARNQSPKVYNLKLLFGITFRLYPNLSLMNPNNEILLKFLEKDRSTALTYLSGKSVIQSWFLFLFSSNLEKSSFCSEPVLIDCLTPIIFNHRLRWITMNFKAGIFIELKMAVVSTERNELCHLGHVLLQFQQGVIIFGRPRLFPELIGVVMFFHLKVLPDRSVLSQVKPHLLEITFLVFSVDIMRAREDDIGRDQDACPHIPHTSLSIPFDISKTIQRVLFYLLLRGLAEKIVCHHTLIDSDFFLLLIFILVLRSKQVGLLWGLVGLP